MATLAISDHNALSRHMLVSDSFKPWYTTRPTIIANRRSEKDRQEALLQIVRDFLVALTIQPSNHVGCPGKLEYVRVWWWRQLEGGQIRAVRQDLYDHVHMTHDECEILPIRRRKGRFDSSMQVHYEAVLPSRERGLIDGIKSLARPV